MKIFIASDHAGFALKSSLVAHLAGIGYSVVDKGPHAFDMNDDYPDFIQLVAEEVACDPESRGILVGGSGQGEAIVANRRRGVRAGVYYGPPLNPANTEMDIIALMREHNDANVLSIGARFVSEDDAKSVVERWLATPFSGEERHVRRIKKIDGDISGGMSKTSLEDIGVSFGGPVGPTA